MRQQFAAVDPFAGARRRATLQAREREQVAHQGLHALRLLAHQAEVAGAVLFFQRDALHGFHKAAEHGQWRADFVRDVGHEVAPHGLGQLHRGHVAAEHELALLAVGVDLHRNAGGLGRTRAGAVHLDLLPEVPGRHVGAEGRRAHEVAHILAQVALGIKAQVVGGREVAPLDAAIGIEQDHAVGRRLDGGQKVFEPRIAGAGLLLQLLDQLAVAFQQLAPQARDAGHAREVALGQPGQQAAGTDAVEDDPGQSADQATRIGPGGGVLRPAPDAPQGDQEEQFDGAADHSAAGTAVDGVLRAGAACAVRR